ncbi:hypothetical protein JCM4814A_48410 [Streptomyces phaeofaciens JCM 4814]|uniref:Uncharacterized protein n=1 Tax=Streptomyces phaeofaciens TaxID=68254 RepID=A0A918H1B3_9ACTN|nr:hypothetical protein [Streptomyces phaeofaciens]GGT31895.1 hypothetical protein GCM10010226_05070 [Streptomyces phaeofaciens]
MLDQLVAAAGAALVAAMATDTWERSRGAVVSLWQRAHPERAETIEAELAEVRDEVLSARGTADEETEQALVADWQRRLRRLVRDDPRLADELRRVLDEALIPALPPAAQDRVAQISIKATTSGHGRTTILGQGTQHNH